MHNKTQKIRELQEKIDELTNELESEQEEIRRSNLDPEEIEIAELLHEELCHHNHTDGCGWYYGNWGDKVLEYSRQQYLDKARKLISNGFKYYRVKLFLECID